MFSALSRSRGSVLGAARVLAMCGLLWTISGDRPASADWECTPWPHCQQGCLFSESSIGAIIQWYCINWDTGGYYYYEEDNGCCFWT